MNPNRIDGLAAIRYEAANDPHVWAIDRLVHELRQPAEEVNRLYREILDEYRRHGGSHGLVSMLVSGSVRQWYRSAPGRDDQSGKNYS